MIPDLEALVAQVLTAMAQGQVAEVDISIDVPEQTMSLTLRRDPFRPPARSTTPDMDTP